MNDCSLADFCLIIFINAQPAPTTPVTAVMTLTPSVAMVNDMGSAISSMTSCSLGDEEVGAEEVGAKRSAGQDVVYVEAGSIRCTTYSVVPNATQRPARLVTQDGISRRVTLKWQCQGRKQELMTAYQTSWSTYLNSSNSLLLAVKPSVRKDKKSRPSSSNTGIVACT